MHLLPILLFGVLFWIACGLLDFGGYYAFCQKSYDLDEAINSELDDFSGSCFMAVFGPLTLIALALFTGFRYGLRYRRVNKQACLDRWNS